jgi:hypothetical protein
LLQIQTINPFSRALPPSDAKMSATLGFLKVKSIIKETIRLNARQTRAMGPGGWSEFMVESSKINLNFALSKLSIITLHEVRIPP